RNRCKRPFDPKLTTQQGMEPRRCYRFVQTLPPIQNGRHNVKHCRNNSAGSRGAQGHYRLLAALMLPEHHSGGGVRARAAPGSELAGVQEPWTGSEVVVIEEPELWIGPLRSEKRFDRLRESDDIAPVIHDCEVRGVAGAFCGPPILWQIA